MAGRDLPIERGARSVPERATFETLARRDDVPGALGAREMKFLILDVGTPDQALYFLNTKNFPYHYDFVTGGLGMEIELGEFNAVTYFRKERRNVAGTIIAHDRFEAGAHPPGLYALEFWPTDPVPAQYVALSFDAVRTAMPFAAAQLAYHPAGNTQEALLATDRAELERRAVRIVTTDELFRNVPYVPLNLGEGYGVLTVFDPASGRPLTSRDVALFTQLPNDLGHVAGSISDAPQTPLSHVNLKAKQNDTPNAYVKNASSDPAITPLVGKVVHYVVKADAFTLEEATREQAEEWLESVRPPRPQVPQRDMTVTEIVDLEQIGHPNAAAVGAKAANVAELRKFLPRYVPRGYAIPFALYDRFMRENGFYEDAAAIVADVDLLGDPAERDEALAALRKKIEKGDVPDDIAGAIADLHERFPDDVPIRCRSSTNNEDLKGFNGAGLYDSRTHRPDEGKLSKTVRQVWASLWTFRGVDEREFHRVDHMAAAMGVLVHQNFDDELANGVAVTKNPFDPASPGFYINVQVGESLVTNPDPNATPDELVVSAIGENHEWETQYIRRSSLTEAGKNVLTEEQIDELRDALGEIQSHFKPLYAGDRSFAMDVEFKVDRDGSLVVKQARPWVD